jgi:hypothetical protein
MLLFPPREQAIEKAKADLAKPGLNAERTKGAEGNHS